MEGGGKTTQKLLKKLKKLPGVLGQPRIKAPGRCVCCVFWWSAFEGRARKPLWGRGCCLAAAFSFRVLNGSGMSAVFLTGRGGM